MRRKNRNKISASVSVEYIKIFFWLQFTLIKKKTQAAVAQKKEGNNSTPVSNLRPRLKHTKEELDRMRKEFTCFKCGANGWTRDHICPNKEL